MPKCVRDVKKIFVAGNAQLNNKNDLVNFVEEPCLAACEDLYDKNILTYWSSSNKDSPDFSFILVRYDFLDATNQSIANRLIEQGVLKKDCARESWNSQGGIYGSGVCLGVDTNLDMPVTEVSDKLLALASKFVIQDIKHNIYMPQYLMEQNFFYRGQKNTRCFPDLKIATGYDELHQSDDSWRKTYDKIRLMPWPTNPKEVSDYMKKVADMLGWIYNSADGLIYKDDETLRRHRQYIDIQNNKMRILQSIRNI